MSRKPPVKAVARGFQSLVISSRASDGGIAGKQSTAGNVHPDFGSEAIYLTVQCDLDAPASMILTYPRNFHIARLAYQDLEQVEIFFRNGDGIEADTVFIVDENPPVLEILPKSMVGSWKPLYAENTLDSDRENCSARHLCILGGSGGRRIVKDFLKKCTLKGMGGRFFDIFTPENYARLDAISREELLFPLSKFLPGQAASTSPEAVATPESRHSVPLFPDSGWPLIQAPSPTLASSSTPPSPSIPPSPTLIDWSGGLVGDIPNTELPKLESFNLMDATEEELSKSPSSSSPTTPTGESKESTLEGIDDHVLSPKHQKDGNKSWIEVLTAEMGLESIEMEPLPRVLADLE